MKQFKVTDEDGNWYIYDATDMRMALVAHHMGNRGDPVKVKRLKVRADVESGGTQ